MAIVLETNARNAACNGVVDLLDGGTIQIQDAANVVLATLTLPTPAFGLAANGAADMNTVAAVTATAGGTAAKALFRTAGATPATVFTATVGTTGADINMSSTTIANGDSVEITAYTHTQPAS